jgi:hypothetical protein
VFLVAGRPVGEMYRLLRMSVSLLMYSHDAVLKSRQTYRLLLLETVSLCGVERTKGRRKKNSWPTVPCGRGLDC